MTLPLDPPGFRHDVAGTTAAEWEQHLREAGAPAAGDLTPYSRVVVLAPHPDDESLGAGGLMATAHALGLTVELVLCTLGEASHPDSPTHTPQRLAALRRDEAVAALAELVPAATPTVLGLPDGGVAASEEELVTRLVEVVGDGRATLLVAPWRHDGHPDHDAAGRAAATAAARTGAMLWEYPVWAWHWGRPDDAPWSRLHRLDLDPAARSAKRRAMAAHRSQVAPLSAQAGDETLLGPDLLAHFVRPSEHFVLEPLVDDALDDLHADGADPWGADSRWYERRKRALLLAALPRERFGRGLEVGASRGALARDLATRCDRLLAVEQGAQAAASAGERLVDLGHVEVRRAAVPDEWPEGRFDLVVVSEVGYFLSPLALDGLVERLSSSLTDDGVVVLCHWRHPVEGWVLDGPDVHAVVRAAEASVLPPVAATYVDRDVELLVLAREWPEPTR
ncbi:bifunctional PIG-L family deacetylase/class I SAM-dependent methyltransferase [Nocardioides sp. 503]|uniref:bifunctional PIG-L family deacetylase/class I SAM-dependent methyltransferase n=1 Tax=Nocardioides sp. 503 TaxID=2508326 RepID=UPI00106F95FA|nr:bifunctional PIG-L family deacetylase/class I SAM-dependent methyltransferase [Nocardioides sp. 503]